MSEHHIWDTPLLFVAALAGLIGVGLGAGHGMGLLDGDAASFVPGISWSMAGICLVFTFGHARGVNQFEIPHLRLLFLACASFFIHLFLTIVAGILVLLIIWMVIQALLDGALDLF